MANHENPAAGDANQQQSMAVPQCVPATDACSRTASTEDDSSVDPGYGRYRPKSQTLCSTRQLD